MKGPAQRTDEWFEAKLGCVSSSGASNLITPTGKIASGKGRKTYMAELACQRMLGRRKEFSARATEHGIETETQAFARLQIETGYNLEDWGFVKHPVIENVGCSPDRIIMSPDWKEPIMGVELKCPIDVTKHVFTIENGMDVEHMPQIQFCMWVLNMPEWLFVSYSNDVPDYLQIYTQVIQRDAKYVETIRKATMTFLEDLDNMVIKLSNYGSTSETNNLGIRKVS